MPEQFAPLHLSNLCTLLSLTMAEDRPHDERLRIRNMAFTACGLSLRADAPDSVLLPTLQFLVGRVKPTLEWLSGAASSGLFVSQELTPLGKYVFAVASQDEKEMQDAAEQLGIRNGVTLTFLAKLPDAPRRSPGVRQVPFPYFG